MNNFLFVHFTGEHETGEQVYFSVSQDGRHFTDLNGGKIILRSTIGEKGVRDPFVVRDEKNGKFYLIATDLRIANGKGWQIAQNAGSTKIVIWESHDLIYWSQPWLLSVGLKDAGNVWAPEVIFDKKLGRFLVFWASKTAGKHKMYGAYTDDFKTLDEPFLFLEKDNDVIDSTIIEKDGVYYRFTKDETTSRIIMEKSRKLIGDYETVVSDVLANLEGVEGPEIYPTEAGWSLIVDQFKADKGYLVMSTLDLEKQDFTILSETDYDFGQTKKRHGGVMTITDEEYHRLLKYYHQQNPVIPGLWADPDLVKFGDTYYIYPTTDGILGWGGDQFSVFASKDLVSFEDAGVIIDFKGDQVPWAVSNAWAPCIAEKNGQYYCYFCGKRPDGKSCIGVAESSQPTGPFVADDQPLLIHELIETIGLDMSQMIDPSVYQEEGKAYILFGNGNTGAIVELTEDMHSIKPETVKEYQGLVDFREAIEVFKRAELYHFTWSCDDTGSPNYHVNYGVSESLFGPVVFKYPVLVKHPELDILGTGHHSIFKEPESDEYYIAYHRFGTPLAKYSEGSKGYNRETCLSPVDFDEAGLMRPVIV